MLPQGAMKPKQVKEVEDICNQISDKNEQVYAKNSPLSSAKAIQGLRAVFDEVSGTRLTLADITLRS